MLNHKGSIQMYFSKLMRADFRFENLDFCLQQYCPLKVNYPQNYFIQHIKTIIFYLSLNGFLKYLNEDRFNNMDFVLNNQAMKKPTIL